MTFEVDMSSLWTEAAIERPTKLTEVVERVVLRAGPLHRYFLYRADFEPTVQKLVLLEKRFEGMGQTYHMRHGFRSRARPRKTRGPIKTDEGRRTACLPPFPYRIIEPPRTSSSHRVYSFANPSLFLSRLALLANHLMGLPFAWHLPGVSTATEALSSSHLHQRGM